MRSRKFSKPSPSLLCLSSLSLSLSFFCSLSLSLSLSESLFSLSLSLSLAPLSLSISLSVYPLFSLCLLSLSSLSLSLSRTAMERFVRRMSGTQEALRARLTFSLPRASANALGRPKTVTSTLLIKWRRRCCGSSGVISRI